MRTGGLAGCGAPAYLLQQIEQAGFQLRGVIHGECFVLVVQQAKGGTLAVNSLYQPAVSCQLVQVAFIRAIWGLTGLNFNWDHPPALIYQVVGAASEAGVWIDLRFSQDNTVST